MGHGAADAKGTLALVGGGEFQDVGRTLDAWLLERSGGTEVVVVPTAAAYEHPEQSLARAAGHFGALGASTRSLMVLHRAEADDATYAGVVRDASFVYLSDGSPLHLRSVIKGSALLDALVTAYRNGAVIAASGAGATVLCDPMVDPRGGAYTVGLGLVQGLAVFPYHGTAADHLRERSIDLLPRHAVLAGIDEETALVREPGPVWRVQGAGRVTLYGVGEGADAGGAVVELAAFASDSVIDTLKM